MTPELQCTPTSLPVYDCTQKATDNSSGRAPYEDVIF